MQPRYPCRRARGHGGGWPERLVAQVAGAAQCSQPRPRRNPVTTV